MNKLLLVWLHCSCVHFWLVNAKWRMIMILMEITLRSFSLQPMQLIMPKQVSQHCWRNMIMFLMMIICTDVQCPRNLKLILVAVKIRVTMKILTYKSMVIMMLKMK